MTVYVVIMEWSEAEIYCRAISAIFDTLEKAQTFKFCSEGLSYNRMFRFSIEPWEVK